MRRLPLTVMSALSLLTAVAGADGAAQADARQAAGPVCGAGARRTVVTRNNQAEVYRVHKRESEIYEYWGCLYGDRHSIRLGTELVSCDPYACLGVSHMTIVGFIVAYEVSSSVTPGGVTSPFAEGEESEWHVVVVNLRNGRVLHKVPTGKSRRHPGPGRIGAGQTTAIVVKSDGAVAWINNTVQKENKFEVHALDATGERVLAVGSNIAPKSLALAGSTLYWTQGGKSFSATLN